MSRYKQFIVVALACEAKPLIAHYKLKKRTQDSAFPCFENDPLSLIISGVGKVAAAAASAYIVATSDRPEFSSWLNVGIAGHQHHNIGRAFVAHKITDASSGRCFYPTHITDLPCPTAGIVTADKPVDDYPDDALVDMEASGFFETASRFSTTELIQSLKIVSDNAAHPATGINEKQVNALISAQLETIDDILRHQQQLAEELCTIHQAPAQYEAIASQWRFSHSEQIQLRDILRRWSVLNNGAQPTREDLRDCHKAKHVLLWLNAHLPDEHP